MTRPRPTRVPSRAPASASAPSVATAKMTEAEVSLRLAYWLLAEGLVEGLVEVAIDGAQVRTGTTTHFDLPAFLLQCGWVKDGDSTGWQCQYRTMALNGRIRVHSNPGQGDVVARLRSGHLLRVECKKGPLKQSKGSPEYRLLREALGQLLTVAEVSERDILAVAVPRSNKFDELAKRWRRAPLVERFKIRILTVDQSGAVSGLETEDQRASQ